MLKAIIFYTHDDTSINSNVHTQKLDKNLFERIFSSKEFNQKNKPEPLTGLESKPFLETLPFLEAKKVKACNDDSKHLASTPGNQYLPGM